MIAVLFNEAQVPPAAAGTIAARLWVSLKRQAIERAAGL